MKKILSIICALLPLCVMGQSASNSDAPEWTKGYFRELSNSYVEVVSAFGYDLKDARTKAAQEAIHRRSLATGTEATVSLGNNEITVGSSHDLIIKSRIIDEYIVHTSNGYEVFLLVQTAKNPTYSYEPITMTKDYPFSARVFVPGMAQIHKGSIAKGSIIIAGEIAAVAGIVAFESMRASYNKQVNQTHNADIKKQYIAKATTMGNIRNGFIAGAAAIYAWNVIDGIVAKGKSHISVGEVASLNITPYTSSQYSGIALCLNF